MQQVQTHSVDFSAKHTMQTPVENGISPQPAEWFETAEEKEKAFLFFPAKGIYITNCVKWKICNAFLYFICSLAYIKNNFIIKCQGLYSLSHGDLAFLSLID